MIFWLRLSQLELIFLILLICQNDIMMHRVDPDNQLIEPLHDLQMCDIVGESKAGQLF
jgi:hypothetical protein